MSWRIIIRPLLPVRVVHKFDFIHPLLNQNQEYEQLLLPHLCEDHIPIRYGGLYKTWPVDEFVPQLPP